MRFCSKPSPKGRSFSHGRRRHLVSGCRRSLEHRALIPSPAGRLGIHGVEVVRRLSGSMFNALRHPQRTLACRAGS